MKRAVTLALLAAACATSPQPDRELHGALCAAQDFLLENGYFRLRANRAVSLTPDEIDKFVGADGTVDLAGLSAARNGTFSNRLIGGRRAEGTGFLVIYDMGGGVRRCLSVSGDLIAVSVVEPPCQAEPTLRVSDASLRCFRIRTTRAGPTPLLRPDATSAIPA